jgi:hypothetical protein
MGSTSQVNVDYTQPKIDSTNDIAYFIKTVTQEYKELYSKSKGWGFVYQEFDHYEIIPKRKWSKVFLCQSKADGSQPISRCELYGKTYSSSDGSYRPKNWASWNLISAFDISWINQHALVVLDQWHENTKVVDLQTGKFITCTIGPPTSGGWSGFRDLKFRFIADDSLILWSAWEGIFGILSLAGKEKSINLDMDTKFKFWFGAPSWNDEHRLMVVHSFSRGYGHEQAIWLYDTNLILTNRIDGVEKFLGEYKKTGKVEHPYAWAIEQAWREMDNRNRHKPPPEPPFDLKTHTIEHKRISPSDASSVW